MSKIDRHIGDNFGGIANFYYAIHQDVANQIDWLKDPQTLSQAFIDANFFQIKVEPNTAGFGIRRSNSANGPQWIFSSGFDLHQDRSQIDDQIDKVGFRKLLLYIVSNNDDHYLIGSEQQGVFQVEDFSLGTMPANLNGYQYKFEGNFSFKPLKISIV